MHLEIQGFNLSFQVCTGFFKLDGGGSKRPILLEGTDILLIKKNWKRLCQKMDFEDILAG